MTSSTARATRLVAALCAFVVLPLQAFEASPDRMVGPPSQERAAGASIDGQEGWTVQSFDASFDQGITTAAARSGSQSWRVSNWFSSGIVDAVRSPAFSPAAEGTPNAIAFQDFWFRVPAGNEGLLVSTSLSDTAGRRMSYAEIRVASNALQVMAVGVAVGDNGTGTCTEARPLLCDAGVDYVSHESPVLALDSWYRLRVNLSLVPGERNDTVDYRVFAADGSLVWQQPGVPSWEDLYWDSIYGSGQKVTVELMQVRLVEDPDASPGFATRALDTFGSLHKPVGLFIDDLAIGSAVGAAQATSFEPAAGAGGLLRFVATTGTDGANDCLNQAFPCATLQHGIAVADPGDSIEIATGTYVGPFIVDRTLTLRRAPGGGFAPELTITSGATEQTILTVANATDVVIQGLTFDVDQSYVAEAIRTQGVASGLTINGNSFVSRQSVAGVRGGFGRRNAVAINLDRADTTQNGGAANISFINNTCTGVEVTPTRPVYFRSCLATDAMGGVIAGNMLTGGFYDAIVRFSTSPVTITGNAFNGSGLQLSENNAGGHTTVQGNTFDPDESRYAYLDGSNNPIFFGSPALGSAAIMLKLQNTSGSGTPGLEISSNIFADHAFAILAQNVAVMNLTDNSFTPRAGLPDFLHLAVSNKVLSSNSHTLAPRAIGIAASGNAFNGEDGVAKGTALEFWNHHAEFGGIPAAYGALLFSGNSFDGDLATYMRLDATSCAASNACALPPFAAMAGTTGVPGTPVAPFAGNLSALDNVFDGALLDANSELGVRAAVESKVVHRSDDPALGLVDLGIGEQLETFVDDDFAGSTLGQPLVMNHGMTGFLGQEVYYGINAFATIQEAIAAVADAGMVRVACGTYPDPVTIDRHLYLIGDAEPDDQEVHCAFVTNAITVAASGVGTEGDDLLRMQWLSVSNPAGDGIRLVGDRANIELNRMVSSGNLGHGLTAYTNNGATPGLTSNLHVIDSHFDNNGVPEPVGINPLAGGMVFDEDASVDGLFINGSTFNGNNALGLSFNDIGASQSGSDIRNVVIDNSEFNANNPGDHGLAGGGIWLKTGGLGGAIANVSITNSRFFDNGTGQTNGFAPPAAPRRINANGISVRVRPGGATMSNVLICNNQFGEADGVGGTQEAGIYVLDGTANANYEPVSICDTNSFGDLPYSVSGYEQYGAGATAGTQPVVRFVAGDGVSPVGPVPNAEFVNQPVTRFPDGQEFPSFTAALADTDTGTGDALVGGVGRYSESLSIAIPGLTVEGVEGTVIDGRTGTDATPVTRTTPGIQLLPGVTGTTLRSLAVRNFNSHCVLGVGGNDGSVVEGLHLSQCQAPGSLGALTFNGVAGIDDLRIEGNTVTQAGPRGIVVWNGVKTNIRILNNVVSDISGCCGIELQDGSASGVLVRGNLVTGTGDNGIGLIGLTGGAGGNVVMHNTVVNAGRYGIEIKNPNGTGVDFDAENAGFDPTTFPDGAIVVAGNTVRMEMDVGGVPTLGATAKTADVAGIVVMRRAPTGDNVDVPRGVVVRSNQVEGWAQTAGLGGDPADEGFGIVVEGILSSVHGNVLVGNEVPIQLQSGNTPAPPASTSGNELSPFFARGNATTTCSLVGTNSVDGMDTEAFASVTDPAGGLLLANVLNERTQERFCTIQAAIDDVDTIAGDVIVIPAGVHDQNVVVSKSVSLVGPMRDIAPSAPERTGPEAVLSPSSGVAVIIVADDVTLNGFVIADTANIGIWGGQNAWSVLPPALHEIADDVTVTNMIVRNTGASGLVTNGVTRATNWQIVGNRFEDIAGASSSAINLSALDGGLVSGNVVANMGFGGIQLITVSGIDVLGNTVTGTGRNGINIAFAQGINVRSNQLSDTNTLNQDGEAALTLYRGSSNIEFSCNAVSGTGFGDFSVSPDAAGTLADIRVFHNQFSAAAGPDVANTAGDPVRVGSNRYGEDDAPVALGAVVLATPTDAADGDPTVHAACGITDPAELRVLSGSGTEATINTDFPALQVRVVDQLGGSVEGVEVAFTANAGVEGATASVAPSPGTSDFDGVVSAVATANGIVGGHNVQASHLALAPAEFSLTNTKGIGTVTWGELAFIYDGEVHSVTASLQQEPGVSCTVTPAPIGPDVGSYSVSASCIGVNYDASGAETATIGGAQSVHVLETEEFFGSVAAALADTDTLDGHTLELAPGTYTGAIVLTKGVHLKGGGITGLPAAMAKSHAGVGPHVAPATIVDGGGVAGTGIFIASGVQGAEISGLEVTGFTGDCVFASQGNNGVHLHDNLVHDCGGHGIQVNGIAGITDVLVEYNEVTDVGNRGIVVWNGAKRDIVIRNNWVHGAVDGLGNVVEGPFATGIAFEDGTATGITVVDNVIENVGDAGITAVQLTSGSPAGAPNTIARNTISNPGRFGIALMIPNGTGLDSGDGAIVVEGNIITGGSNQGGYPSDRAGISVVRRFFIGASQGQVDATMGVVLHDNGVSNFIGSGGATGYGIVVEGTAHTVHDNIVMGNDVGLQLQQGNQPLTLPGSANVDDASLAFEDYFDRGNATQTCASLAGNDLAGNTTESRFLPATGAHLTGTVLNQTAGSWHCSLNQAIAAASPGDTLQAMPGVYREEVLVDRSLTLLGPFAGTHGDDEARTSDGEAVIDPVQDATVDGTQAVRIGADGVVLDGFTITGLYGTGRDAGLASGINFGVMADGAVVQNNRFVALDGFGLYTITDTSATGPLSGWQVRDNLFEAIGDPGEFYSAVNLLTMVGAPGAPARVTGNVIRDVSFAGVQLIEGEYIEVADNQISSTGANGVNVGPKLTGNVDVHDNSISASNLFGHPTEAAVVVFGGSSGVDVYCNTINTANGPGTFAAALVAQAEGLPTAALGSDIRVFHNAVVGDALIANGNAAPFVVGSNWYSGGSHVAGGTGGGLLVADPLAANPVGNLACGDNSAVAVEMVSGDDQATTTGQPFGATLVARVEDALGGAVPGQEVGFTAPLSGASASLDPASATSDYNGLVQALPTANVFAGSYTVLASVDAGGPAGPLPDAAFLLENVSQQQVVFDLNGPVGGIEVGDTVAYTGFLANENPTVAENVIVHVEIAHDSAVLDASELAVCVVDPGNASLCHPISFTDEGATLSFDFPDAIGLPGGVDITPSYAWTHQLRTVYGKAGVFTATAQVVGITSGTVYAGDAIATEVVDQHAGVTLALDGPVAGIEKGAATPYAARLTNTADAVADPVLVEFTITRDGGIQAGDLTVEYDTGGGAFAILPLFDAGGMLVGQFGPGTGFALPSGYDATTAFRVTYHVAPHSFSVAATVVDAAADSDGVPVYAADQLSTQVIDAAADVAIALTGPFDPADGTTLVVPVVGDSVLLRGALANSGGPVPDLVQAAFTIGASFSGIAADDLTATYWFVPPAAACGAPAPEDRESVVFTDDGETLSASTTPQPLTEGMAFDVCFELGLIRAGAYNIAAVIGDAAGDTDGVSSYAADNLALAVGKATAIVTINGAVDGLVQRNFTGAPQVVTASTTAAITGSIGVTYAGSASAPTAPGTYALQATLVDPDYAGVASGSLVISDAASVTLTLAPLQDMAFVDGLTGYTGHIPVTGTVANAGPQTSQAVHTRISVVRLDDGNGEGGQPVAIVPADVQACVFDPEGYDNQAPDHQGCPVGFQYLFTPVTGSRDGRPAVQFRYPNLPENDAPLGSTGGFAAPIPEGTLRLRTGEYRVYLDVVGTDGTVYASVTSTTTSVPDASIAYSGPLSGAAEQLLVSQTTLRNQGGRSVGNVLVRVTLSDALGGALTTADAELFYQLGGDYAELPLVEAGGDLVTLFGPPTVGFPLEDGHDQTTAGGAVFHRTGEYLLSYEVLDAATLGTLFASSTVPVSIDPNMASFSLGDLVQTYDGTGRAASVVAAPVDATYTVAYAPFDGAACGTPLAGLPVDAGSYCVDVVATGNWQGSATGVLVVQPAEAGVALDPASLSVVFDGAAHAATATTTPAGLPVAFTYDGSSDAPVNVGSYTVIATVTDPNYTGGTSGILAITPASATLSLAGDATGAVVASGGPLYSMSSGTVGLSGPAPQELVRAFIAVSRPGGIVPGDVSIEYLSTFQESASCVGGGAEWWCPLPLSDNGDGTVGAAFGPASGFPLGDGNDSFFRTQYHRGGQYHTTVRLDGVDSLQTWAIGAATVDVAELTLLQGGPTAALTNTEVGTSSTLRNIGAAALSEATGTGPTAENVIGRFVVSHADGALSQSDLALQYLAPDGSYQPLPLVACGDALCGSFGPSTGFPVDAGYLATSLFRTVFSRTGGYLVETTIEGVDSGAMYAEASQAFMVSSGSAAIQIDPASLAATYDGTPHAVVVSTDPPGLTFSITYDGSATVPVDAGSYLVEATITDPDFTGTATGTLSIAPKMVTIALADLGPYTYDGTAHPATASIPDLVAGDSVDLLLSYNGSASEPVDAGTYLVVASFDPALAPNYVALPAMELLTIAKAAANVSFDALGPFTYTGAPVSVAPLNPNGVALSLAYVGVDGTVYGPSAVPPIDVGSYQATATVDDANYEQAPVTSGTFLVEPADVTVSFGSLAQVYDGTSKAVTVSTVPAGVAVDVAYAQGGTAATPVNAGDYDVTGTVADPNYVLSAPATATLTIAKATAQVTLSDLTQLYDGTPRPVSVATAPLGLVVEVTYEGGATAPTAVGSYAVVATVDDANYEGTASGTLTVLAAAISEFEVVGAVAFNGTAGVALSGDLPTVQVLDANGGGVPGVSVVFQQVAGGSSGAGAGAPETVTTDADGRATVSGWLLPADAGDTVMTAQVSGLAGLPTLEFTVTGAEVADIAVLKTATQTDVIQGGVVDYTITVSNAGPSNAASVELADVLPGVLDVATAQWTCVAADGAACGVANGTGDVAVTLAVPVGGTVTVLLSATVETTAALGPFDNTAGVLLTSGSDGNVDNDTSTATVTVTPRTSAVFSDGFEGDDAAAAQRDAD